MLLSKSINLAKRKAEEIQTELNGNQLPVDLDKIASKLGVEIRYETFPKDEVSGLMKRKGSDGLPIIAVNNNHPEKRQRFTIAHELGHFLLHSTRSLHIDRNTNAVYFRDENSSDASRIKEIQANQFAAELLMPKKLIMKDVQSNESFCHLETIKDGIKELAKKYNVSEEAMSIRATKYIC